MQRLKEVLVTLFLPDDAEGDPSDYGSFTAEEAPDQHFSSQWTVSADVPEAPVGRVFVFTDGDMILTRDERRRAICVYNSITGESRWVPMDKAFFGADQIHNHVDLGDYRKNGYAQSNTPLARVLQRSSARAPKYSVLEKWQKSGADPNHRSEFKHPYRPRRIR